MWVVGFLAFLGVVLLCIFRGASDNVTMYAMGALVVHFGIGMGVDLGAKIQRSIWYRRELDSNARPNNVENFPQGTSS